MKGLNKRTKIGFVFLVVLLFFLLVHNMDVCVLQNSTEQQYSLFFSPHTPFFSFFGYQGLDLSFVTHLIILDQLASPTLLQQLVARAWRIGSRQACQVFFFFKKNK